jgi:HEAT repeat protein
VQSAACEALGLIDPGEKEAVAAVLKKKLDHPDPLTRVHAALALFLVSGDKAGEKVAERVLGHRTYQVRLTAAEALWRMNKDERVVLLLVRTLEESNLEATGSDNDRYMAVRALGRIGAAGKPAVGELLKLLTHPDAMLAAAAAQALKAIDPEAAKKAGVK